VLLVAPFVIFVLCTVLRVFVAVSQTPPKWLMWVNKVQDRKDSE